MPSSIKLTEPLDILVEYGYLDDETPYHKAVSNAVVEFTADKTLGGEYNRDYIEILQKEAKKELKLRRKKINVKSFKENFLNKKEEPVKADTTGESSLSLYKPPVDNLDLPVEEKEEQKEGQKETEGLKGIRDILDDILKVLRLDFKDDRKEARDARKATLDADRKAKENKLEGGLKKSAGLIGKSVQAMVKPFSNIWDAIINFLKFTLIGALFNKTLKWFQDPKNEEKAKRIGKFFSDWWPALSAAALLFLTPLGGLLKGVVGLLTAIIPKLVIAIAANPYAALALVGTGLAIYGVSKLASGDKKQKPVDKEVDQGGGEDNVRTTTTSEQYTEVAGERFDPDNPTENQKQAIQFKEMQENSRQGMNEGGLVQHYNDQKSAQNFIQKFNEGGLVQNFNEGGMVDKELVYSLKKFNTEKVVKGNEIERIKTREKTQGSIKLEDLYANQDQILSQLPEGTTIESIVNGTSDIDAEVLYPILQNSDAQAVSNAKERAATMQMMQENNLINSDNTVKGFSSFNQNFKGGGLVDTYNNLTKIKNYKQGGFVSGPGGVDKVPARLTAGEFVMSKGAVQKFGVNTLASMNAAGGGTNVPTITQEYNEGGLAQYFESGGIVRDMAKEPVGTPIVNSTNKTITLPTIPKQQRGTSSKSQSDIPDFRIPKISSQRSMVIASLGIEDLIGG